MEGPAILHVALAREILLADFARLGLLNSGRPNTLVLVLGVPLRSLGGLGRDFRELQGQPSARSSALAALPSFASFATRAATSNCTSKVVRRSRLVSLQLVLRGQRLESLEELLKNRNRKMSVFTFLVELCQILQLFGSGSVMTFPACLEGAHQEEREDAEVELGLEHGQLLVAIAELVENGTKSLFGLEVGQDEDVIDDARLLGL